MRRKFVFAAASVLGVMMSPGTSAQRVETAQAASQSSNGETIKALVGRLELERYKATVKGLTEFGDRRQGTDRNRKAVDWIEAQLKSYG
ncbi:MAG TPA: hypothetical protein VFI75_03830, partial [Candidatus Acidoferrum sp.]|nr:hypothetical protein [Candidatus Acidoferrum sp.]